VILFFSFGCSTAQSIGNRGTAKVEITSSGYAKLGSKTFPQNKLAEHLKKEGANSTTSITIAVPKETSNAQLADITRQLRKAGFIKIIFTKPSYIETSSDTNQ